MNTMRQWLGNRLGRVPTPLMLQMEVAECGAAALGIVLGALGKDVSLEQVRQACGVSRDGVRAADILEAAKEFGLEGKGYSLDLENIETSEFPLIIHWKFNHFVVLEGVRHNRYYINDPAAGHYSVDAQEFDRSFTGIALSLQAGPSFEPGRTNPTTFSRIRQRVRRCEWGLVFILLINLLLAVPAVVVPIFSKIFIDDMLVSQDARVEGAQTPSLDAMTQRDEELRRVRPIRIECGNTGVPFVELLENNTSVIVR